MSKKNKQTAILNADKITEEFIARCERYLSEKKMILWGQAFDINDPNRRRVAAEWLASEIVGLMIPRTERIEP